MTYFRCPVYNNLPSNKCYLLKVAGKCCNEPRCQLENGQTVNPLKEQTKYTIIGKLPNGYTGFGPNYNFSTTLVGGGSYQNSSSTQRNGRFEQMTDVLNIDFTTKTKLLLTFFFTTVRFYLYCIRICFQKYNKF